ncbi:hypothetical protein [Pseudomonas sp. W5-01]|uniref:hypothetical protein n=1 Tax=Pseudomonas sp. W5-01 TaxID=3097454 RepID=UPI00397A5CF8
MDWKQFIAAIVTASAWPVAAVVLVMMLKGPLVDILGRIRSLKIKDFNFDLSGKLDEVAVAVAANASEPPAPVATAARPVLELARIDPRSAVLSAWLEVEKETEELALKAGIEFLRRPPVTVANELHAAGLMDELVFSTYVKLRRIRNEAAHLQERDISFEEAVSMANLCHWLANRLHYERAHLEAIAPAGVNP